MIIIACKFKDFSNLFIKSKREIKERPLKISKLEENLKNSTRIEWERCKSTLETSGEDVKLHSKRVGKM